MTVDIEKLKREIEGLEKQLEANPFGGLFNKDRMDQIYRKLKKKRKELARLEKPPTESATGKPATKESVAGKDASAKGKTKRPGTG